MPGPGGLRARRTAGRRTQASVKAKRRLMSKMAAFALPATLTN
jgi:hypothetical protein